MTSFRRFDERPFGKSEDQFDAHLPQSYMVAACEHVFRGLILLGVEDRTYINSSPSDGDMHTNTGFCH